MIYCAVISLLIVDKHAPPQRCKISKTSLNVYVFVIVIVIVFFFVFAVSGQVKSPHHSDHQLSCLGTAKNGKKLKRSQKNTFFSMFGKVTQNVLGK